MEDLEGNVERAEILRSCAKNSAIGEIQNRSLLINNTYNLVGSQCLIKIAYFLKSGNIIGHFLTRNVPQRFQSLDYKSHLLLGLWEEDMAKAEEYPSLLEINKYYNPGKIGSARYMQQSSSCRRGRVYISPKGAIQRDRSFDRFVIDNNPTKANCNLLLTESQEDLQKASEIAQNRGITPITLERLDRI